MIKVEVDERTEVWECGDGCCTEYTYYFTVKFDGRAVLEDFESYDEDDAVFFALKKEGILEFPDRRLTLVSNDEEYKQL